ncbi:MAG: hypothetical protein QG622_2316 [Actinomycetota bacterium]|nr:hypothetical protein [Actinomycetota bacterium]
MVTLDRPATVGPSGPVRKVPAGGGSWIRAHGALSALVGVVLLTASAGGAYLLTSSSEEPAGTVVPPVRPKSTSSASGGASSTASGGATASSGGTTASSGAAGSPGAATGRNPFGVVGGTTGATPTTASTGAPADTGPTAMIPPGATSTLEITVTRNATTTVTTSSTALFLGLYGWSSGGLPTFVVNETTYTAVAVGATFGGSLVYVGKTVNSSGTQCATVTYGGSPRSVCEGSVVRLR